MTMQSLERPSQGWRCQQCGLPGVRVSDSSSSRAYFKCVPCNRSLGLCPCTTPGARTTSTCPCGAAAERRGSESSVDEDEVPRGVSMISMGRKNSLNPHNPDEGFDEDWEANCSPGFMVKRFKASGREFLPH